MPRSFPLMLLAGLLLVLQNDAQTPAQQTPPANPPNQMATPKPTTNDPNQQPVEDTGMTIGITVQQVTAPVLVYDADGNYVNGLRPGQFHLFDNSKEQDIRVDEAFQPISMVILIQANSAVEHLLPTINHIGNLMQPLVLGERGEAAVVAFDSRIRTLQDFTSDGDKITQAVKKIQPGSMSSHLIDGVEAADRMLASRPQSRRRVLLEICENRDMGSEARARETLIKLQLHNIVVYSVDISRLLANLNGPTPWPRPDNRPPAMNPMPSNMPATPTTVMQTYGTEGDSAQFMPLLLEIYRDTKAIFKTNPVHVFTKGTGGTEYAYYRGHGLEQAIQDIANQLQSEYMISYRPNNLLEGGFHQITLSIDSPLAKRYQTRPGYWLAARNQ
jgi:VWFA-related protein